MCRGVGGGGRCLASLMDGMVSKYCRELERVSTLKYVENPRECGLDAASLVSFQIQNFGISKRNVVIWHKCRASRVIPLEKKLLQSNSSQFFPPLHMSCHLAQPKVYPPDFPPHRRLGCDTPPTDSKSPGGDLSTDT